MPYRPTSFKPSMMKSFLAPVKGMDFQSCICSPWYTGCTESLLTGQRALPEPRLPETRNFALPIKPLLVSRVFVTKLRQPSDTESPTKTASSKNAKISASDNPSRFSSGGGISSLISPFGAGGFVVGFVVTGFVVVFAFVVFGRVVVIGGMVVFGGRVKILPVVVFGVVVVCMMIG